MSTFPTPQPLADKTAAFFAGFVTPPSLTSTDDDGGGEFNPQVVIEPVVDDLQPPFQNPTPAPPSGLSIEQILAKAEAGLPANPAPPVTEEPPAVDAPPVVEVPPADEEPPVVETPPAAEAFSGLVDVAAFLEEKGLLTEVPESLNLENFTPESFYEVLELNVTKREEVAADKARENTLQELGARLSESAAALVNFELQNPGAREEEIAAYMESLLYSNTVAALSPDDLSDAKSIVYEYKRLVENLSDAEIAEEIKLWESSGILEQRAAQLKPRLEQRVKAERDQKAAAAQRIKDMETARQNNFNNKVLEILRAGKVGGIDLKEDEKQLIWGILANHRIPVRGNGGRPIEISNMENVVRESMYGESPNYENVIMAALILKQGPEAVLERMAERAKTKKIAEVQTAVKTSKFKTGASAPPAEKQPKNLTTEERAKRFFSTLNN